MQTIAPLLPRCLRVCTFLKISFSASASNPPTACINLLPSSEDASSSMESNPSGLANQALLDKIDQLRELNVQSIELPQVGAR
jgi:hypothetical protein